MEDSDPSWFVHFDCGEIVVITGGDPWAPDDLGCLPIKVEPFDCSRVKSMWDKNGVTRVSLLL